MSCVLMYILAFFCSILVVVLLHFFIISPFLVGLFRGQPEMIAGYSKQPSKPHSTSSESASKKPDPSQSGLVRPMESVISFFQKEKLVTSS